jgi:hypothetical protein
VGELDVDRAEGEADRARLVEVNEVTADRAAVRADGKQVEERKGLSFSPVPVEELPKQHGREVLVLHWHPSKIEKG